VQNLLLEGKKETPKPDDPSFRNVRNLIIGNNEKALKGAESMAKKLGYNTSIHPRILKGEAREAPHKIIFPMVSKLLEDKKIKKPAIFIMGGETTVTLRGNGRGGRNQELALSALIGLKQNWTFVSMGTDGIDGNSDAAGAFADSEILSNACKKGLRIMDFLENNNSNEFFAKTSGLLITGPTGTNVADIAILLVE
jgi:hydroxypyruvate reductase/glycerate 2-kinase